MCICSADNAAASVGQWRRVLDAGGNVSKELDVAEKGRLLRRASYASTATAGVLILVKLLAWLATGSISVLASLVDSLMDSIASLINLFAIRYSLQPPDTEHRFGHGKAEPLAGLAQAGFISGSAVFLVLHALDRLRNPQPLHDLSVGVAVMVFAIVLTLVLVVFQRRVIARTGSTAIRADSLHYVSDLLGNIAIISAMILASMGWTWADPVFAIALAVYIAYTAIRVGMDAVQQLMDRELSDDLQRDILESARAVAGVQGVHDLRTRQSGQVPFVQLHLELDGQLSLQQAHAIADRVEAEICVVVPGAEVIVHQDPVA